MSLEGIERSIPLIADGEDRHVEDKHWIVHSSTAAKYSSPEISPLTVHFLSRVHLFSFSWSVVEQKKGKKADQNSEHRTENSEPECNVPVCASEDRDFAREYFWKRCHDGLPYLRFSS